MVGYAYIAGGDEILFGAVNGAFQRRLVVAKTMFIFESTGVLPMSKNRIFPVRAVTSALCFCGLFGAFSASLFAGDQGKDEGKNSAPDAELFCGLEHDGLSCETTTQAVHNVYSAYARRRFCTLTTEAARFACLNEAEDDRWIAVGNCLNSTDHTCFSDAYEEALEAQQLCAEQFDARLEVCDALGEDRYDPMPDPADFVDPAEIGGSVDANPYFPLVRGTVWVYEGEGEIVTVTVTGETKQILGVTCAVVRDVVEADGELVEDTFDWYAQDLEGNVWYFGEIARNYEDGELVDLEGSWKAGVDSAKIGVLMPNAPQPGAMYRQEFLLGEAEDMAEVLKLNGTATTPAAACTDDCLVTLEYTPVEPDAAEHKYYAPGIGMIMEVDPETDEPIIELVEITTLP